MISTLLILCTKMKRSWKKANDVSPCVYNFKQLPITTNMGEINILVLVSLSYMFAANHWQRRRSFVIYIGEVLILEPDNPDY